MAATKPAGCSIAEHVSADGCTLSWPQPSGGLMRFFAAAFMTFWLCGWAIAEVTVAGLMIANGPHLFGFAWLGIWTLGGIMVILVLYRLVQPNRPESVTLGYDFFRHDPGRVPHILFYWSRRWWLAGHNADMWREFLRPRKPVQIRTDESGPIVLERIGERQRLRYDLGAERIEIGRLLREPEREWLAQVIREWQGV